MKKVLSTLLVAALLVVSATGVFALEDYVPTNDSYSISYSTDAEEAMYGVVVLSGIIAPNEDYTVSTSNIIYIDQVTSDEDGDIAISNFAPLGAAPSDDAFTGGTVIIGGGDLASAEIIGYLRPQGYAPEEDDVVYGDLDGDGSATMNDAIIALRINAHLETPTDAQSLAGDVDGDGGITMNDAILILQRNAQIISSFPVENLE